MTKNGIKEDPGHDPDRIAFQGIAGAYSDIAARALIPKAERIACLSFEDVFAAIESGTVDAGLIPVENSIAGRVVEIHTLLAHTSLFVTAEHYQPVRHQLLALPGADPKRLTTVYSHAQALSQCRDIIHQRGLKPVPVRDTAAAAQRIAEKGDRQSCAIASALAGDIYGLVIVAPDIADRSDNITRFFLLSRRAGHVDPHIAPVMTTLVFKTSNRHGALYRALGHFANAGINLTRLEGLVADSTFQQARFHADVEGHPDHDPLRRALAGLAGQQIRIIGSYYSHRHRLGIDEKNRRKS